MVLSSRVPGAARARRIASLLQALTKAKEDTLKNRIFEYTNPKLIQPGKRLSRGVAISVASALASASVDAAHAELRN
jgi:hypothetical protein